MAGYPLPGRTSRLAAEVALKPRRVLGPVDRLVARVSPKSSRHQQLSIGYGLSILGMVPRELNSGRLRA